jgi:glycosyltransferase involved in cell wall biosynthesis
MGKTAMKLPKAGIYSPYWDTGGGGEKYILGVIKTLFKLGFEVEIFWPHEQLTADSLSRFGVDIQQARINKTAYKIIKQSGRWWVKKQLEQVYDLLFFVSDGSVPWLFGRQNLLHFQVPFHQVKGRSVINRLKLNRIQSVICNSQFTKRVIDKEFGVKSMVLYPPVTQITPGQKQKLILSVGRFDNLLHSKRHDALIKAFSRLHRPDWRLVLAGGVLNQDQEINILQEAAKDLPVEILTNPDYQPLCKLYQTASIYWHASGFGQDLKLYPERAEHFGISTVEAMSAGAVPVVFNGGGQREIIQDNLNGYLWNNLEELTVITQNLIDNETKRQTIAHAARERAVKFNEEAFTHGFTDLLY